jgi:hypothetical protein
VLTTGYGVSENVIRIRRKDGVARYDNQASTLISFGPVLAKESRVGSQQENRKKLDLGRTLTAAGHWLRDNGGTLLLFAAAAALGLGGVVGTQGDFSKLWTTSVGIWSLVAAVLMIAGVVITARTQISRAALMARVGASEAKATGLQATLEANQRSLSEAIRGYLFTLARYLGLGPEERISVYVVGDSEMRLAGRFSQNADYDKVRRRQHALGVGIIGKVATTKQNEVWEITVDPAIDPDGYCACHTVYKITPNTAAQMTMRTRSYEAIPLSDFTGTRCKAVLLCESTTPGRFTAPTLKFKAIRRVEDDLTHLLFLIEAAKDC